MKLLRGEEGEPGNGARKSHNYALASTTSSLGVSSHIVARGRVGVGVCHIQVDCTSPTPCTSTCSLSIIKKILWSVFVSFSSVQVVI